MRLIEMERCKPIEEVLAELCEEYTRVDEIATELGIQESTAYKWLVRFGFEKRWMIPEPAEEEV